MKVSPSDLMGIFEIAEMTGHKTPAIMNRVNRDPHFPAPLVTLACGPIYHRKAIAEYFKRFPFRWSTRQMYLRPKKI